MGSISKEATLPTAYQDNCLMSRQQVEKMLNISRPQLHRLMSDKKDPLPSYKIGGRLKFKLNQVIWWIDKQER